MREMHRFKRSRPLQIQRLIALNILKRCKKKIPEYVLLERIKKAKIRRKKRLLQKKRLDSVRQPCLTNSLKKHHNNNSKFYVRENNNSRGNQKEAGFSHEAEPEVFRQAHVKNDLTKKLPAQSSDFPLKVKIKSEKLEEIKIVDEIRSLRPDRTWNIGSSRARLLVKIEISSKLKNLLKERQSLNVRNFRELMLPRRSRYTNNYYENNYDEMLESKTSIPFVDVSHTSRKSSKSSSKSGEKSFESMIGGMTLSLACSFREIKRVYTLLSEGADPNKPDIDQLYPLLAAIKAGSLKCTEALLDAGANVNFQDIKGWTPLHMAASLFSGNVADLLILNGAILDAKDDFGNTPIFLAAQYGRIKCLRVLIRAMEDKGLDLVNVPSDEGMTPLLIACQENHRECVSYLLSHGADANICTSDELLPIHVSARVGSPECVSLLLKHTNLEDLQKNYESPLFLAIEWKAYEVLEKLIKSGLPLNYACISYFDYYTPSINIPISYGRFMTPLVRAIISKDLQATNMLLSAGVSPCPTTKDEFPAIIPAADKGGIPFIELLLIFGLDINWKSSDKVSCPDILFFSLHDPELIELLLKSGLNVRYCFECECGQETKTKVSLCHILTLYENNFSIGKSIEKILGYTGKVDVCAKTLECLSHQANWELLRTFISNTT